MGGTCGSVPGSHLLSPSLARVQNLHSNQSFACDQQTQLYRAPFCTEGPTWPAASESRRRRGGRSSKGRDEVADGGLCAVVLGDRCAGRQEHQRGDCRGERDCRHPGERDLAEQGAVGPKTGAHVPVFQRRPVPLRPRGACPWTPCFAMPTKTIAPTWQCVDETGRPRHLRTGAACSSQLRPVPVSLLDTWRRRGRWR